MQRCERPELVGMVGMGRGGGTSPALSPPEASGHFQLPHPRAQIKLGGEGKKDMSK